LRQSFNVRYAQIEKDYADTIRVWENEGLLKEMELLEDERAELLKEFEHNTTVIEKLINEHPLTNGLYLKKRNLLFMV
jgi:uncharacterized Fe-S cluster-containing MiaB family protein